MLTADDLLSLVISFKLALITTFILMVICIPLAWWLVSRRQRPFSHMINALCTTPLILPPSVLGFYLLLLFSPSGLVGKITIGLGLGVLSFSFSGLVIASVIYSLPFVLQPLQAVFQQIGRKPWETAIMLGLSPWQAFWRAILPLARNGIISAAILGFAHTIGEFGIVLLIGGNLAGKTQVVSIQIYNHVEAFEYASANQLSLILLGFSIAVLVLVYWLQSNSRLARVNDA